MVGIGWVRMDQFSLWGMLVLTLHLSATDLQLPSGLHLSPSLYVYNTKCSVIDMRILIMRAKMRKSQSTVANSCQWRMSVHNPRQTDTIVDLAQWLLPGIAQASLPILFCSLHVFPSASVMLVVR